jgi:hypothetical protein
VDELDDMMGLGTKNDFFNNDQAPAANNDRDPLGFLKKSEQVKKEQEEQRKQKALEAIEDFKLTKDLTHNHGGYDCGYEVDYEVSQRSAQGMPMAISMEAEQELMNLLFPDPRIGFLPSWKQGFYFDKHLKYGIYQN